MMKRKRPTSGPHVNLVKIKLSHLRALMGEDYVNLRKIEKSVFCPECDGTAGGHLTTIIKYTVYLNEIFDVVLRGKCEKCGAEIDGYIATGSNPARVKLAEMIWNILGDK